VPLLPVAILLKQQSRIAVLAANRQFVKAILTLRMQKLQAKPADADLREW
jgi:hypothetical protein